MPLASLEHYASRPAADPRMSIDFLSSSNPAFRLPPLINVAPQRPLPSVSTSGTTFTASGSTTSTCASLPNIWTESSIQLPADGSPDPDDAQSPTDATSIVELLRNRYPRPARPSYSESQRFYIMYARINLEYNWPEIQRGFWARFGKKRSKSGLCSVYYRTRRAWGMEEVLVQVSEGPDALRRDRQIVCERAWRGGFLRHGQGYT